MRKSLEELEREIKRIDGDNLYEAVNKIQRVLYEVVVQLDLALPKDVSDDI